MQAIDKLSGNWKLLYTVNSELTGLLGLGRIPGVEVGEISQDINASNLSAINTVTIAGPLSRTAFSAKAALEVQSPKRVQVSSAAPMQAAHSCTASCAQVSLLNLPASQRVAHPDALGMLCTTSRLLCTVTLPPWRLAGMLQLSFHHHQLALSLFLCVLKYLHVLLWHYIATRWLHWAACLCKAC